MRANWIRRVTRIRVSLRRAASGEREQVARVHSAAKCDGQNCQRNRSAAATAHRSDPIQRNCDRIESKRDGRRLERPSALGVVVTISRRRAASIACSRSIGDRRSRERRLACAPAADTRLGCALAGPASGRRLFASGAPVAGVGRPARTAHTRSGRPKSIDVTNECAATNRSTAHRTRSTFVQRACRSDAAPRGPSAPRGRAARAHSARAAACARQRSVAASAVE